MRRMYPDKLPNLVKNRFIWVGLWSVSVRMYRNLSECIRMYPNVSRMYVRMYVFGTDDELPECIRMYPNVSRMYVRMHVFGTDDALMLGITWDLTHCFFARASTGCGVSKPSLWLASGMKAHTGGPTTTCIINLSGGH